MLFAHERRVALRTENDGWVVPDLKLAFLKSNQPWTSSRPNICTKIQAHVLACISTDQASN